MITRVRGQSNKFVQFLPNGEYRAKVCALIPTNQGARFMIVCTKHTDALPAA